VRTKFPPLNARLKPGTTFVEGACRVEVRDHSVVVVRGSDRMLAPNASLYRVRGHLVLVSITRGQADVRTY